MMDIIKLIPYITATIAAFWALYIFNKQQKFKRLQNLSSLWKEFSNNDQLLELFDIMDQIEIDPLRAMELAQIESKVKLKYLALIEEVALYIENFEIDKKYAKYLFQWHFFYAYESKITIIPFWQNLGGEDEMKKPYWGKSRNLATKIKPQDN